MEQSSSSNAKSDLRLVVIGIIILSLVALLAVLHTNGYIDNPKSSSKESLHIEGFFFLKVV